MMRIRLLCVGKIKEKFIREGCALYKSRLSHYLPFTVVEVKEEKGAPQSNPLEIKKREGRRLLDKLETNEVKIVLDSKGIAFTSENFSAFLLNMERQGRSKVAFILGGPLGLDEKVTAQADYALSLSSMTLTHEMSRLVLVEQIYRAMTIMKGEPYHK
jgi:23S rRNA (pseudouridine1915-N3)-methyltransferase